MEKKSKHIFEDKVYKDENFKEAVKNFSFISKCKFINCDFTFANFKEAKVFETEFENCNFYKTHWDASGFKDVIFKNCTLDGTFYSSSKFINSHFKESYINSVKFRGTHFKESLLENIEILKSEMSRSIFENSKLNKITFSKCKMFMFMCLNANLSDVEFKDSNLTLSKFLDCKKKNTVINETNKQLCMFIKNNKVDL